MPKEAPTGVIPASLNASLFAANSSQVSGTSRPFSSKIARL